MEMDQQDELMEAQERLMRRREEERMTVQEDLGYQRNTNRNLSPLFPKRSDGKIFRDSRPLSENKIKITYIKGIAKDLTHRLRRDIAEDLINRGYAIREE